VTKLNSILKKPAHIAPAFFAFENPMKDKPAAMILAIWRTIKTMGEKGANIHQAPFRGRYVFKWKLM